jgi:hypothetical protein
MEGDEPAFPVQDASKWQAHGLTIRQYIAIEAMKSILSNAEGNNA